MSQLTKEDITTPITPFGIILQISLDFITDRVYL